MGIGDCASNFWNASGGYNRNLMLHLCALAEAERRRLSDPFDCLAI